jgi:4-amino-4-deoxy-L-arabinose transferase-like glycosyltransferase
MTVRRSLWIVCLIAALHSLFFIWYQRPDWATEWTDQDGYRRLGQVLAESGKFTRFPNEPQFVPEVIRTPVYPAFLAVVYRLFGVSQIAVALAQTVVFIGICLLVFAVARRATSDEVMALLAAMTTALFPPLAYFVPLVMTEVWTTLLFTASMWAAMRALKSRTAATFAWLGVLIALTALSRPVFVLFPFALAAVGTIILPLLGVRSRPAPRRWAVMLVAFAVTMLPWFTYNYVTLGRFTLSPAGGIGRGLWEGSWQAAWSGRLQNELTHLADEVNDRVELDRRVDAVAAREQLPAAPMLEYVHQWQDIRRIWTEPVEPHRRAAARVEADQAYQRAAIDNLAHERPAHLLKRLTRGVFILWAGEIPFRYSQINRLPPLVIRLCWAIQAVLCVLALAGLVVLARRGRVAEACLLAAPLVYVTAVHFPLLTEARQSLPAQPVLLLLAAIAMARLAGHSLPLEAQVHEREHL